MQCNSISVSRLSIARACKDFRLFTRQALNDYIYSQVVYWCHTTRYTLADSGFFLNFQHQGGLKHIVSGLFEELKFKI